MNVDEMNVFSRQLLLESIRLLQILATQTHGDGSADALLRLSQKIDNLSAQVAQNQEAIMATFDQLTAQVATLTTEVSEITAYINSEAAKLAALFAENVALTAKVADLELNQITAEDRTALAANEAAITAAIAGLNAFTPPPVDPPVEGESPNINARRNR